jgi:manganese-transporting P-type ATPase
MKQPNHNGAGTIQSLTILRSRHTNSRLDVAPFAVVHVIFVALHVYASMYAEDSAFFVLGLHLAGLIAHLMVFICRQWSVEVEALVGYTREVTSTAGTHVLAKPFKNKGTSTICPIETQIIGKETYRYFLYQRQKYILKTSADVGDDAFPAYHVDELLSQKIVSENGLNEKSVQERTAMFGPNSLAIPPPKFVKLFQEQLVAPFFLFQAFCCALWCLDEYWYYSVFTFVMILLFEVTMAFQRMKNMEHIYGMVRPSYPVWAFRNMKWVIVQSEMLLPGDLVDVEKTKNLVLKTNAANRTGVPNTSTPDFVFPCDALLLSGTLLVNEAMLTGESEYKWKSGFFSVSTNGATCQSEVEAQLKGKGNEANLICGGTNIVRCESSPCASASVNRVAQRGVVAYVLKTGFGTKQGEMMRTIFYFAENITGADRESYLFIFILVVFASIASMYVWTVGLEDEYASRWRLCLHCIMIITSVVPPELPMELSITVTTSLTALRKLHVFCSEPFRIPIAGKVNICCFDKTGTLTSDSFSVSGLSTPADHNDEAGFAMPADHNVLTPSTRLCERDRGLDIACVLAGCHGLANVNKRIVGDSMEKAILEWVGWELRENGDIVPPANQRAWGAENKESIIKIRILRRLNFSSKLKRMCCVIAVDRPGEKPRYMVVSKGAPEMLRTQIKVVPGSYDNAYIHHTRHGSRVLALAYRHIPSLAREAEFNSIGRNELEKDFLFGGFVVMGSPLKPETKKTIGVLRKSLHRTIMITGDNAYTARDVAIKTGMSSFADSKSLILEKKIDPVSDSIRLSWVLVSDEKQERAYVRGGIGALHEDHLLCVTGSALDVLSVKDVFELAKYATVFSRVSPQQKEQLIIQLKKLGTVLMCGDGSNDVGALRQADVGISVINNPMFERKHRALERARKAKSAGKSKVKGGGVVVNPFEEESTMLELGDASQASPFTSRHPSIRCAFDIICQGRCTLVSTVQMYKILGINCMVSAYALSALHLYGIKQGDTQATYFALVISILFFLNSRSKPMRKLSPIAPPQSIFESRQILSIVAQVTLNFSTLILMLHYCKDYVSPYDPAMERDGDFSPNIINSALYLMSATTTINSFVFNYTGKPYMESFFENKWFSRFSLGAWAIVMIAALGIFPPINDMLELVHIESPELKMTVACVLVGNTLCSFILHYLLKLSLSTAS